MRQGKERKEQELEDKTKGRKGKERKGKARKGKELPFPAAQDTHGMVYGTTATFGAPYYGDRVRPAIILLLLLLLILSLLLLLLD